MATTFECDPVLAGGVSAHLTAVRSEVAAAGQLGAGTSSGSEAVDGALSEFFADSGDSRTALLDLLERAAGLLRGLADGTDAVDQSLAQALTPNPSTPR